MFSTALIALAVVSGVFAAPDPTKPGPTDSYTAGGNCDIAWTADPTGKWTTMNIQFMTGINSQMTAMRTIATLDATKQTTFSWVCPEVNPNAPIYFYQFSSPSEPDNLLWVTRFVIKGTDGSSTAAPLTDPSGVPYGIGTFTDPSLYNAPPAYLAGNGQLQGAPGNGTTTGSPSTTGSNTGSVTSTTGSTTATGAASTPSGSSTGTITKVTSTGTSKVTSAASTTATTSTGGAVAQLGSSWMTVLGALVAGAVASVAV